MALTALTVAATVPYVSDMDPCKVTKKVPVDAADPLKGFKTVIDIMDGATTFHLKPLDVYLMGQIYDNAQTITGVQGSAEVGIKTKINQTNIDAVRFGLASFENFSDAKGEAVSFETVKEVVNGRDYQVVKTEVLNVLGLQLIGELAGKIKSISEVSAEEAKNSE